MKIKFILAVALIIGVFVSCSDDDGTSPKKKYTMITSLRSTGAVYAIDVNTGELDSLFTGMYSEEPVIGLRGCVYHSGLNKFFVTQTSGEGGGLYTIDPATGLAELINGNDGQDGAAIWDAVVNWTVVEADSLLGYGDFNGDGNGIYKFGVDGGRAPNITEVDNICCGLGMIFDNDNETILFANGNNTSNGEITVEYMTFDGEFLGGYNIRNFVDFPDDFADYWLTMKALAEYNGTIYGLMYAQGGGEIYKNSDGATFFVKIDIKNLAIKNIAKIGETNDMQYNMLYTVPASAL